MKIWIDRKGNVRSFGSGSVEQQYNALVKILAYLQKLVAKYETVVAQAGAKYTKESARAIREEASEMGILQ